MVSFSFLRPPFIVLYGAVSTTTDDLALYCAASADYAAITADVKPWQPS